MKNTLDINDNTTYLYDFNDAINKAIDLSFNGSTILLSPGFSSFDQFNNYKERGDAFKEVIQGRGYYAK